MSWIGVDRAQPLTITGSGGKVILRDVAFELPRGALLVIMGPSGAGKSTLLNALTGLRFAAQGSVRFFGADLYDNYQQLGKSIAYVPREDNLHRELRLRHALWFIEKLRPQPRQGRRTNAGQVIRSLQLEECANRQVGSLSEGQFKRARIAAELLAEAELLVLDEPTSNVEPRVEDVVVQLLDDLRRHGTTIVLASHSSRLLTKVRGGDYLLFLDQPDPGQPAEIAYFGSIEYAFDRLGQPRTVQGADDVVNALFDGQLCQRMRVGVLADDRRPDPPVMASRARQLQLLLARSLLLTLNRTTLLTLAAQTLVLGLLLMFTLPADSFDVEALAFHPEARTSVLFLVFGVTLLASFNATDEIVREFSIFRRERATGLSIVAYILSKAIFLGGVAVLQTLIVLRFAIQRLGGPDVGVVFGPNADLTISIVSTALAAMSLGLVISAASSSLLVARSLLSVAILAQLVLSGALVHVADQPVLRVLSWLNGVYWGFSATASTVNLNRLHSSARLDDLNWVHSALIWARDVQKLWLLTVVQIILAALILRARTLPMRPGAGRIGSFGRKVYRALHVVPWGARDFAWLAALSFVLVLGFGVALPAINSASFTGPEHRGAVTALSVSSDGDLLASASDDGTVKLWAIVDGRLEEQATFNRSDARLQASSVVFLGDRPRVAAGYDDGLIILWDVHSPGDGSRLEISTRRVLQLVFSTVVNRLAWVDVAGNVHLWDPDSKSLTTREGPADPANAPERVLRIAFSSDGTTLALGLTNGTLLLWNWIEPSTVEIGGSAGAITGLAWSPDGEVIATGLSEGLVALWDPRQVRPPRTLQAHGLAPVHVVSFAPAGGSACADLVSGGADARLARWRLGEQLRELTTVGAGAGVLAVTYTPDGRLLLAGSADGRIHRWTCG